MFSYVLYVMSILKHSNANKQLLDGKILGKAIILAMDFPAFLFIYLLLFFVTKKSYELL